MKELLLIFMLLLNSCIGFNDKDQPSDKIIGANMKTLDLSE